MFVKTTDYYDELVESLKEYAVFVAQILKEYVYAKSYG